jgi:hypothetical protein
MVNQKAEVIASDAVTGHTTIKAGSIEATYSYDDLKMMSRIDTKSPVKIRDLDLLTLARRTNLDFVGIIRLINEIQLIDTITTIGTITTITGITNPINVKTSGGTNIMLDVLTQGAYTERRSTLSNNGAAPAGYSAGTYDGKFYPRGCRGFVDAISVYCRDNGAAGGTIAVYLSPNPNLSPIFSGTVTVPAGGAVAWRLASIIQMWNYDSMFIFVIPSTADMQFAYDAGAPLDRYYSTDAGVTWNVGGWRAWFSAVMTGETCGDVPVSGTVNNVELPSVSSHVDSGFVAVPAALAPVLTVAGAGFCDLIFLTVTADVGSQGTVFQILCDGSLAMEWAFSNLNAFGFLASTPAIALLQHNVNGVCTVLLTKKFAFKQTLQVKAANIFSSPNILVQMYINKLS